MMGSPSRRTYLIQQVAILVVLALALVTLFLVLRQMRNLPPNPQVTYRVESDSGVALISFTESDMGMTSAQVLSTPWKATRRFARGDTIYLTAGNSGQYGSISCEISIEGQVWKSSKATYPDDKVACAGIIP
ncbi:MAG TPA: hypothetical protein VHO48_02650 [Anaerolineaceae bacterium]|nr:hypothetical protein [Anaerolineaceae bacterium]